MNFMLMKNEIIKVKHPQSTKQRQIKLHNQKNQNGKTQNGKHTTNRDSHRKQTSIKVLSNCGLSEYVLVKSITDKMFCEKNIFQCHFNANDNGGGEGEAIVLILWDV